MPLKKVLIIGPSPQKRAAGIVTHIKNLLKYRPLQEAVVFDVGSLNARFEVNRTTKKQIFKNLFKLRRKVLRDDYNVLLNASLSKTSIHKLLLILLFIGKTGKHNIHIFFHGGRVEEEHKRAFKLLSYITKYWCAVEAYHFLSEIQKRGFKKFCPKLPAKLYNNFSDSNEILNKNGNNEFTFLFVGRLNKEKGILEAIKAVKRLREKVKKAFKLKIVGDGAFSDNVHRYVKEHNLEAHVHFTGYLSGKELNKAYSKADCLLFPTFHPEGFPYVYIESMRAGLPVIATQSGALSRLIKDDYNGLQIKKKDIDDLVQKMEYVLSNEPDLEENCYNEFINNLSKASGEEYYTKLISR